MTERTLAITISALAVLGCAGLQPGPEPQPPEVNPPPDDGADTPRDRDDARRARGGKAGAGRVGRPGQRGREGRRGGGAAPPPPDGRGKDPVLTEAQRIDFLWWLEELCPEQWCAGPNDYQFADVACDGASTCTLSVQYLPHGDPPDAWQPATCAITGITRASDLVVAEEDDKPTEAALQQVGDCLARL